MRINLSWALFALFVCIGALVSVVAEEDSENIFRNPDVIQDSDHIQEHLKGSAKVDVDKMTPLEKEFHFFKMHDNNDDNLLDGIELFNSLMHKYEHAAGDMSIYNKDFKDKMNKQKRRAMVMVDRILEEDDKDGDGYMTYSEYSEPRRRIRAMTPMQRVQREKEAHARIQDETILV